MAAGDVNGDGFLDLAAIPRKGERPRVFLFDGKKSWEESSRGLEVDGFSCGGGVEFFDADGDGNLDLFVADHCTGLYLFLGDGKGGWMPMRSALIGPSIRMGMNDLELGDLDLDGNVDIVTVSPFGRGIRVFLGDGKTRWKETDTELPRTGGGYLIRLQDLNSDGRPEILTSHQAATVGSPGSPVHPTSPVWINQGDGRWKPAGSIPNGVRAWDLVVLDPSGTPELEILLSGIGKNGGIHLLRWDKRREDFVTDDTSWLFPVSPEYSSTGLALDDFTGDGTADLAVARYRVGGVHLFLAKKGAGWFECPPLTQKNERDWIPLWGLLAADLNADGRLDLVSVGGTEGGGKLQVLIQDQAGREFP